VTFINTNGMAFFGPGSEWFWAALQFTALAITFIAIYRQLRVARSVRAVELVSDLTRQFDDERMLRHRLSILLAVRDELQTPVGAGTAVGIFFEGLGTLSRRRHLDVKLLWSLFGHAVVIWWLVFEPFTKQSRSEKGADVYTDFEWLVGAFTRMDRRGRHTLGIDAVYVRDWLAGAIEGLQERIWVEESLRTVTIAPSHSPSPAQSAAPASIPTPSGRAENEPEHRSD
jgi:hypothetical protein